MCGEVSVDKRFHPRWKREILDLSDEVLASHCLANGDPWKVDELKWDPSLFLEECEFIVSFRQGLVTPGWDDVFQTANYRVK